MVPMIPDSLRNDLECAYFRESTQTAALARIAALALVHPEQREGIAEWLAITNGTRQADSLLAPPRTIGPYKILDVLGEGGMGIVYAAEQSWPIARRVALKVIKVGMDTKEVLGRFDSERQALAMLDHPNVARVLEAGATEGGRPYFSMELVHGQSISQYADAHRLTVHQRVELVMQACAGLQHAHDRGIVHRDVKPSNLLVATVDGRPQVKVIDFGLAKATNHRLTSRTSFTRAGRIVGTPAYMSPEQAERTGLAVDSRTDVFSLGVVLYELLAGVLPVAAQLKGTDGPVEPHSFIVGEDPPTPSQRLSELGAAIHQILELRRCRLGELVAALRCGLEGATMTAMARDRNERYASCRELAEDLQCCLAGEPLRHARKKVVQPIASRVRRWARHHRYLVGALCSATLATSYWLPRTSDQRSPDSARAMLRERDQAIKQLAGEIAQFRSDGRAVGRMEASRRAVVSRADWGAVVPEQLKMVRRDSRGAAIMALSADDRELPQRMRDEQLQALATGLGDIQWHFVVDIDGDVAIGRSTEWRAWSPRAQHDDVLLVGILTSENGVLSAQQRSATFGLLEDLTAKGAIDRSVEVIAGDLSTTSLQDVSQQFVAKHLLTYLSEQLAVVSRSDWQPQPVDLNRMDPMGTITRLTLHHSAVLVRNSTLEETCGQVRAIDNHFRRDLGTADIGYHFLVDLAGRVIEGRSLAQVGTHAGGSDNLGNIGICLLGNLIPGARGQAATKEQLRSLQVLVDALSARYSITPDRCLAHSDLRSTDCPGTQVIEWLFAYRVAANTKPK